MSTVLKKIVDNFDLRLKFFGFPREYVLFFAYRAKKCYVDYAVPRVVLSDQSVMFRATDFAGIFRGLLFM